MGTCLAEVLTKVSFRRPALKTLNTPDEEYHSPTVPGGCSPVP